MGSSSKEGSKEETPTEKRSGPPRFPTHLRRSPSRIYSSDSPRPLWDSFDSSFSPKGSLKDTPPRLSFPNPRGLVRFEYGRRSQPQEYVGLRRGLVRRDPRPEDPDEEATRVGVGVGVGLRRTGFHRKPRRDLNSNFYIDLEISGENRSHREK